MKFLVLALCVCAASAASFGDYKSYSPFNSAAQVASKTYNAAVAPFQVAAKAVGSATLPAAAQASAAFYQPAQQAAAAVYQPAQQAASAVYQPAQQTASGVYQPAQQAASGVYQPAQQVVTKSAAYTKDAAATILRSESDVRPDGYNFAYETDNGISAESSGVYKGVGEAGSVVVQGSYRYVAPDGTPVYVTYIADENGFQPQGDLLPKAPAVPEAIVRSLAYIASHPQASENVKKY